MKFRQLIMNSEELIVGMDFVILNVVKNLRGVVEVGDGCE